MCGCRGQLHSTAATTTELGGILIEFAKAKQYIFCLLVDFHYDLVVIIHHFPGALLCPDHTNAVPCSKIFAQDDRPCLVSTYNKFMHEGMPIYVKCALGKSNGIHAGPCCCDNNWKSILGEIEVERLKSLEAHATH